MRFQSTQASCGPAALRNALRARGIERTEEELGRLAGYRPDYGTSPQGLQRALRAIATEHPDVEPAVIREADPHKAVALLRDALSRGFVALMTVDNDEHWVVCFGLLGTERFHVADSAHDEMVLHYNPAELKTRWKGQGRWPYFAIIL